MSFLIGPFSGALVAGGVYYGFSTMIQSSTEQHKKDLHRLSRRLLDASTEIPAPLPAVERIQRKPFLSMIQARWNSQLESVFKGFGQLDTRAVEWGKRVLYGDGSDSSPKS
ncbi:hypothetical protein C8Q75DRAFT_726356 [Abortiporus biennis]|nr:hypothetical protein C8Q75DRAFT_726356 [Abortiporus biennis]